MTGWSALPAQPGLGPAPATVDPVAAALQAGVLPVLQELARAATPLEVAEAFCRTLAGLAPVRAAAVVRRSVGARQVLVVGSSGYPCGTMAAGAALPVDSGLPVTEAVRTGRAVRVGTGPGWCAVPFPPTADVSGAVLVSLTSPPPATDAALAPLALLAQAVGDALARSLHARAEAADLAALVAELYAEPSGTPPGVEAAIRHHPLGHRTGGDVTLLLPAGTGGCWLLVADACGSGVAASPAAARVRTAVTALAAHASDPADLLAGLDRTLRTTGGGRFVTALAGRLAGGRLTLASAGHPAPLLLTAAGVQELPVEPGPPLALESDARLPPLAECQVMGPGLLVAFSDGLVDRRRGGGSRDLDAAQLLSRVGGSGSAAEVADRLLAAANTVGRPEDDTSLLVLRLPG